MSTLTLEFEIYSWTFQFNNAVKLEWNIQNKQKNKRFVVLCIYLIITCQNNTKVSSDF